MTSTLSINIKWISIHAPREGSDYMGVPTNVSNIAVFLSTLPARGATNAKQFGFEEVAKFLSTLPARGATQPAFPRLCAYLISIHAPREGSDARPAPARAGDSLISIHAPREGSDPSDRAMDTGAGYISIHAPREGSDALHLIRSRVRSRYFYPRSPRGERLGMGRVQVCSKKFLSTLPARGATLSYRTLTMPPTQISIHAPREGSDTLSQEIDTYEDLFLSTLPARGATQDYSRDKAAALQISIHAPREGSDAGVLEVVYG